MVESYLKPITSDPKLGLELYIYDYLIKEKYNSAAKELNKAKKFKKSDLDKLKENQNSFIWDWWLPFFSCLIKDKLKKDDPKFTLLKELVNSMEESESPIINENNKRLNNDETKEDKEVKTTDGKPNIKRPTSITLPPLSIPVSVIAPSNDSNANSNIVQAGVKIPMQMDHNNLSNKLENGTQIPVSINPEQQFVAHQHALLRQRLAQFNNQGFPIQNLNTLSTLRMGPNPSVNINPALNQWPQIPKVEMSNLGINDQREIFNQHQKRLALLKLKMNGNQNLVIGPRPANKSVPLNNTGGEIHANLFNPTNSINLNDLTTNNSLTFNTNPNINLWNDPNLNTFNNLTGIESLAFMSANDPISANNLNSMNSLNLNNFQDTTNNLLFNSTISFGDNTLFNNNSNNDNNQQHLSTSNNSTTTITNNNIGVPDLSLGLNNENLVDVNNFNFLLQNPTLNLTTSTTASSNNITNNNELLSLNTATLLTSTQTNPNTGETLSQPPLSTSNSESKEDLKAFEGFLDNIENY